METEQQREDRLYHRSEFRDLLAQGLQPDEARAALGSKYPNERVFLNKEKTDIEWVGLYLTLTPGRGGKGIAGYGDTKIKVDSGLIWPGLISDEVIPSRLEFTTD